MSINDGEEILDALLSLGYRVQIADDGAITATQASQILRGKVVMGTMEWADTSSVFRIERARPHRSPPCTRHRIPGGACCGNREQYGPREQ